MAAASDRVWHSDGGEAQPADVPQVGRPETVPGARRASLPTDTVPQVATRVERVPDGEAWLHEPELVGYRVLCRVSNGRVALVGADGSDLTDRFGPIADAVKSLECSAALLDGEVVLFDERGISDVRALEEAVDRPDARITLVAFDLLHLNGWDLRDGALRARKELLRRLLADARQAIRYGDHVEGHGQQFYREGCRLGLEGVVSKRADDAYSSGRTESWLVTKCRADRRGKPEPPSDSREGEAGKHSKRLAPAARAGRTGTTVAERARVAGVNLTHPDKVLFPERGITKRELARYYQQVADVALPYLRARPLTLVRCPEGHTQHCFYQKHIGPGVPRIVPRVRVKENEEPYAMIDSLTSVVALVQLDALEFHVWGSRAEHLDQPDIIVFDLDPSEELAWGHVVDAAHDLRERLTRLGLPAFARVTGGKGLHVVVPVVPGPSWPEIKGLARGVANEIVRDHPKRFTTNMSKRRRGGKIFLDYLRNDRESTAIASYSARAKPGAPVALPLEWESLDEHDAEPPRYSILEVPALLRQRARDPWEAFETSRQRLLD